MSDHTLLLGGAERKHRRVRGFAEWSPHRKTRALLVHVNAVLHEYALRMQTAAKAPIGALSVSGAVANRGGAR
jgi:hypothetical protein